MKDSDTDKAQFLQRMAQALLSLEPLPEDCLDDIASLANIKQYSKKAYFAEEGQQPTDLAFLCDGVFRAFFRTPDGVEYNKTFFTENTFMVALTAIVNQQPNLINIQALTDSTVLQLNYYHFQKLFDSHHILERLTRRLIEYEWAKKEVREIRLVLNDATERYRFFQEEHPGLENRIPQYHIASYLGVTPIQLSRIRAKIAGK